VEVGDLEAVKAGLSSVDEGKGRVGLRALRGVNPTLSSNWKQANHSLSALWTWSTVFREESLPAGSLLLLLQKTAA
jgi:hypothetical protein